MTVAQLDHPLSDPSSAQDEFSIQARSCTLRRNASSEEDVLLAANICYQIPIFQRPYSWGSGEIQRLLDDLLNAFAGRLGRAPGEPSFIGTMQLAAPQLIDGTPPQQCYDIIDGQQRMTTFALLLRALHLLAPNEEDRTIIWLNTSIGAGTQQGYLKQALTDPAPENSHDPQNRYLDNLRHILEVLQDDQEALGDPAALSAFRDYLTSRVFFVVIETRAGLSKTLQIFDSINTSGLALDGGDVFKIRYFEYLRVCENEDESVFGPISDLYGKIDQRNQEGGRAVLSMPGVLGCAKWLVCEELKLPYQARELAGTTFFDRLFDTVLGINRWDGFTKVQAADLSLPTTRLDKVTEAAWSWQLARKALSDPEALAMEHFIWWGRYGNYHDAFVVLFHFRHQPDASQLAEFLVAVGKLHLIYSVRFQKKTYEGRGVMHQLLDKICNKEISREDLLADIRSRCASNVESLRHCLNNDWIASIPKSKNLLCRLVALLDELEEDPGRNGVALCELLFTHQQIDIEHIEAANNKDGTLRQEIRDRWGQDLHGLGNLTVLEREINRSISNEPYYSHKRDRYRQSRFNCVRSFAQNQPTWSLQEATQRKTRLADRLVTYLCGSATAVSPSTSQPA